MRTRHCTPATTRGRRDKALQFLIAAETLADDDELGDAYVTNCIHAGIAAADVLCCRALGEHALGENHQDALTLIADVPDGAIFARHLRTLLAMKTAAGYGPEFTSPSNRVRAGRAMTALIRAMRDYD